MDVLVTVFLVRVLNVLTVSVWVAEVVIPDEVIVLSNCVPLQVLHSCGQSS